MQWCFLEASHLVSEIVKVLYAQGPGLLNAILLDPRIVRWNKTAFAVEASLCVQLQQGGSWYRSVVSTGDRRVTSMVYRSVSQADDWRGLCE